MPERFESQDSFVLSESIKQRILAEANQYENPEFILEIPLKQGTMTVRCFQGSNAEARARITCDTIAEQKDFVGNVTKIGEHIYAFIG